MEYVCCIYICFVSVELFAKVGYLGLFKSYTVVKMMIKALVNSHQLHFYCVRRLPSNTVTLEMILQVAGGHTTVGKSCLDSRVGP